MHLSVIQWASVAVAVGAAAIQVLLLAILIRKKRHSDFPVFFCYAAFYILGIAVGLAGYFYGNCQQYSYIYWTCSFLFMVAEFGVMYEVFVNVLRPYSALVDLGKMLFTWAAVFLFIAATITAFATTGSEAGKLTAAFAVVERSMRLMECGLLLLFFFFEKRLNFSWRNANVGIAIGLGTTSAVDLMVSYLKSHFPAGYAELDVVNGAVYIGILLFWSYCLASYSPERQRVLDSPNRLIFQRWNEALTSYGYGEAPSGSSTVESFLPGIEKTVDRVLARKILL